MLSLFNSGNWVSQSRFSPILYLLDCQHTWLTSSTCSIGIGRCRDDSDFSDLIITANINLDITVSGVGGLDTGIEAVSTWYYVYVIADSTGTNPIAGLISASPTAPTMPAGYDLKRRVGSMYNDASGNLREWNQYWTNRDKLYIWQFDNVWNELVLSAGNAVVITNVSCSLYAPPTSRCVYLFDISTSIVIASNMVYFGIGSSVVTQPPTLDLLRIVAYTETNQDYFFMITDNSQNITYRVTNGAITVDLACGGYIDELN